MKRKVAYALSIILLAFIVGPLMSRKSLVINNIKYVPISKWTKENIGTALFYFEDGLDISIADVQRQFTYADSLIILKQNEQSMNRNELDQLFGYNSPLFKSKISQYLFFAKVENTCLAGEESVLNEVHYLWLPWGWYKLKSKLTGTA